MINREVALGHAACFTAYAIFGINIVTCKDLTSSHLISPIALFTLRSVIAGALFWILSAFTPKEKVALKDFPRIFLASVLGFLVPQLTFLMAIPDVSPMTSGILSSLAPIYTMFIAAVAIKEPITFKKAAGVVTSLCGMLLLVFSSVGNGGDQAESTPTGILLLLLNGFSFALYLGAFKPIISKYSVVTFMKWIFVFSTVMSLPLSAGEITDIDWRQVGASHIAELAFLIFFATFVSYFLIPVGQKRLRPTLVSMYSYLQPLVATLISVIIGMDLLNWKKILSAVLVFGGVVLVNRSKSAASMAAEQRSESKS